MNAQRIAGFPHSKVRKIPCSKSAWLAIAAWLLLALASGLAGEEVGRIEGRIANQDGIGISGVEVTIEKLGRGTVTGSNGRYAFEGVPPADADWSRT